MVLFATINSMLKQHGNQTLRHRLESTDTERVEADEYIIETLKEEGFIEVK